MKLIPFSQHFPVGHVNAGKKTYFVEKILNTFGIKYQNESYLETLYNLNKNKLLEGKLHQTTLLEFFANLEPIENYKIHTIRKSNFFQKNDIIQPFVWSRKPYASPQIRFIPELKILSCQPVIISKSQVLTTNHFEIPRTIIAKNDGLSLSDFNSWFQGPKPFEGFIIDFVIEQEYGPDDNEILTSYKN